MRFRSYLDGSERFMAPETSMEIQAALGSDLALVFDECTPLNVPRDYTARSTERTHRWLRRCLDWHHEHGPDGQLVYGIVQGGVFEDLRLESAQAVAASECDGIAIGGSLGADKAEMHTVVDWTTAALPEDRPRHLLGIGEIDDLVRGVELGIDTFDCAMPTRLGRHGMVLVPDPERRWRVDLSQARWKDSDEPLMEGCPCPACALGLTRGYLRYLAHARELTGMRLFTLHNLAFVERVDAPAARGDRGGDAGGGGCGVARGRGAVALARLRVLSRRCAASTASSREGSERRLRRDGRPARCRSPASGSVAIVRDERRVCGHIADKPDSRPAERAAARHGAAGAPTAATPSLDDAVDAAQHRERRAARPASAAYFVLSLTSCLTASTPWLTSS